MGAAMNRVVLACILFVGLALIFVADPALAAPGGRIARAAFESFWGRVALVVLTIVFLPLIIISTMKERRAARRAQRDLAYLARLSPAFRWLDLRERALACFQRVHAAWRREDVREAAEFMTDWYWQNQQLVVLDRWAAEGLVNHCEVKSVSRLRPILVMPACADSGFQGSKVVIEISAEMQDYLARREDGEIVEGSKAFKEVASLWTFELADGRWRVSNIEDSALMGDYLALIASQPRAEAAVRTG